MMLLGEKTDNDVRACLNTLQVTLVLLFFYYHYTCFLKISNFFLI